MINNSEIEKTFMRDASDINEKFDSYKGDLAIGQRIPPNFVVLNNYKLRIPKGTKYRTTHPQKDGVQVAKRTYTTGPVRTKTSQYTDIVTWPGSGGYWCWTKKENVEFAGEC